MQHRVVAVVIGVRFATDVQAVRETSRWEAGNLESEI